MTLEEWLDTVPGMALRKFAEDMPHIREQPLASVRQYVLTDPVARDLAERSKAVADAAEPGRAEYRKQKASNRHGRLAE